MLESDSLLLKDIAGGGVLECIGLSRSTLKRVTLNHLILIHIYIYIFRMVLYQFVRRIVEMKKNYGVYK